LILILVINAVEESLLSLMMDVLFYRLPTNYHNRLKMLRCLSTMDSTLCNSCLIHHIINPTHHI